MSAKLLVARKMVPFDEQMDVELTEDRRETVDIVEFVLNAAARYAQPIAERLLSLSDRGHEEPIPMNPDALGGNITGSRLDDRHLLRRGQHCPHADRAIDAVHAEKRKRVVVAGLDDRLDLRVKSMQDARLDLWVKCSPHPRPSPSWPESRVSLLAGCRPRRAGSPTRRTPRRLPFRAQKTPSSHAPAFCSPDGRHSPASSCGRRRESRPPRAGARPRRVPSFWVPLPAVLRRA